MITNKKFNNPELIYEVQKLQMYIHFLFSTKIKKKGAVLIWNISLPFINASYRTHIYKAFVSAC